MTCEADPPMFHVSDLLTPALTRPRWPSVGLTRWPDTAFFFFLSSVEGNALVKRSKTTQAETREAHSWTHTLEYRQFLRVILGCKGRPRSAKRPVA
ncbi:hypothetical protein CGRA01v4_06698 [Colletotrichum graminicola]|nr:hypothetical protein CGRA01v4_06698 [Colletotrichum graminicola]